VACSLGDTARRIPGTRLAGFSVHAALELAAENKKQSLKQQKCAHFFFSLFPGCCISCELQTCFPFAAAVPKP
jgi:hypothetical protein